MGCAQAGQNFATAESVVPQFEQLRASGVAHSSQNRAPWGFSCWHRGHFIAGASSGSGRAYGQGDGSPHVATASTAELGAIPMRGPVSSAAEMSDWMPVLASRS